MLTLDRHNPMAKQGMRTLPAPTTCMSIISCMCKYMCEKESHAGHCRFGHFVTKCICVKTSSKAPHVHNLSISQACQRIEPLRMSAQKMEGGQSKPLCTLPCSSMPTTHTSKTHTKHHILQTTTVDTRICHVTSGQGASHTQHPPV